MYVKFRFSITVWALTSLLVDWADNGRDILNFLHYFIPSSVTDAPLPTHLRRVAPEETHYRQAYGFRERTLVGIGHSYGGCTA